MSSNTLFLVFAACSCLFLTAANKIDYDREYLIDSAIQEVKQQHVVMAQVEVSTPDLRLSAFKKASPEALAQGKAALLFENMVKRAEKKIIEKERQLTAKTNEAFVESLAMELLHKPGSILTGEEIARIYQESECEETVPTPTDCNEPGPRSHRKADGTCNNLEHPTRGAANTRLRRLIQAHYDDGISRPRGFLQNQRSDLFMGPFSPPVPSPRVVSLGIVQDREVNDSAHTLMLMQWGQFMDHDMTIIPEHDFCPPGCEIGEFEGSCYPFPIPLDDRNVRATRVERDVNACHRFRRSLGACEEPGPVTEVHPRQQLNAITHFVDGTTVYHSNDEILNTIIRNTSSDSGLLSVSEPALGTTLPSLPTRGGCTPAVDSPPCFFFAGDVRVNEHPSLITIHTIWLREHNRVATFIKNANPGLSSDEVFLLARDIVISEIQKIHYKEYLPIILGDNFERLIPEYSSYNPSIDPSLPDAFSAAAFRFGHSMVQPFFERLDENFRSIPAGPIFLNEAFFNVDEYRNNGGTDPVLRGLLTTPPRQVDEFLNSVLTNTLFSPDPNIPGFDLASTNIQRGRDHGLPTYLTWKQWATDRCNLTSDGFRNELTEIHLLQTYGSLDNVDLFVGGLAESPLPGALVGAVIACIFSNTFINVRDGDRFFYENSDPNTGLYTPEQIAEIERTSLSRIICDNSELTEVQENAFFPGERVSCNAIPSVNLSVFVPANTLPEFCFIKVGSSSNTEYLAISARVPRGGDDQFHISMQTVSPDRETCFQFLCPEIGNRNTTDFTIFPTTDLCTPVSNPILPASSSRFPQSYTQLFTARNISPRAGLYSSRESCESGSSVALNFNCRRLQNVFKQQSEGTDRNVTSIDELRSLVPNEELLNDFLSFLGGVEAQNEEDKLIFLMEDVLARLQSKNDGKEKYAEEVMEEDMSVLSKLEKALKKMD